MSKVKLLLDVITDIRSLADSLQVLADAMAESEPSDITKPKKKDTEKPKEVKLEDVRMVLADKSRSGKTAELKALISTFGAEKLSDIDQSNYAELLKKAKVL